MVAWRGVGDKQQTIHHLRRALEQKMMPFYFLIMPMMRGFENEPEYIELRKKVGLN
jgi:hypothetical protein